MGDLVQIEIDPRTARPVVLHIAGTVHGHPSPSYGILSVLAQNVVKGSSYGGNGQIVTHDCLPSRRLR
jgi:hypothetical protein